MHGSVFKEQEKNAALRETHIPAAEWVKNVFTWCTLSIQTALVRVGSLTEAGVAASVHLEAFVKNISVLKLKKEIFS